MNTARIFFRTLKYRWLRRSLVMARQKVMRKGHEASNLLLLAHSVQEQKGIEVANKALGIAHRDCNALDFTINTYGLAIKHRIPFEDAAYLNLEIQAKRIGHG